MAGNKTVGAILAAALVTGCVANDQNLTRAQGAGVGVAVGAGLGALISGDTEGALVGAAVGGLAGLALGDAVARKKSDYASTEAMIREERRIARQNASEMAAYNASLTRHLETLDRDIARLEDDLVAERANREAALSIRSQAKDALQEARRRLAEVNQEVAVSQRLYDQAKAEGPSPDLVDWDRQIGELERRRDELMVLISAFESRTSRIS